MKTILLLLLLFTTTFTGIAQDRLFRDQDPVPADFGKEKTVLLVINSEQKKVNKALEDAFEKHYKGEYEIIDESDLSSSRFSDTKKYRYCFRTVIGWTPA